MTEREHVGFPPGFVWGVATSSYQIEGASDADGRGVSIWDTFAATPGKIADGSSGAVACDHYHRWADDLDLMQGLGVQAYRFSVAWPRVIPTGAGAVQPLGLDFYDRLVDGLLARGIEPHVTLYHWDLPQPLQDVGGWANRGIVDAFVAYADAVTGRLGDRVSSYATLNEPWCSAFLGYDAGEHAPGLRDRKLGLQAAHHLLLAHGSALPVMRGRAPRARHGIVLNLYPSHPASESPEDAAAAWRFDGFFNRWYLDPLLRGAYPDDLWRAYGDAAPTVEPGDLAVIARPIDFLGVNYYSRAVLASDPGDPETGMRPVEVEAERTAMGWEVYPQGLTELLVRLARDYPLPPVYVTENGAAYPDEILDGRVDDVDRVRFLERHVDAVREAVAQGVDVRGYFAWSLMDNFEWAHGYGKRFGLVHVDFETLARTPKQSALWYADMIERQRGGAEAATP
jgi:beta-glucosidase